MVNAEVKYIGDIKLEIGSIPERDDPDRSRKKLPSQRQELCSGIFISGTGIDLFVAKLCHTMVDATGWYFLIIFVFSASR